MAIQLMDTAIFGPLFGSQEAKAIFDEKGVVKSWLMFERTLATVQAGLGIIPKKTAEEIYRKATLDYVSLDKISEYFLETGLVSVAIINALKDVCSMGAGEYIHYGATSQDLYDTSLALRLKQYMSLLVKDLERVRDLLLALAMKHKKTVMIGRTHGKHAIPITFGFKVAISAQTFHTHIGRAHEIYPRITAGSLSGAVGTFSSFKAISDVDPLELERQVLGELGLSCPLISVQPTIERFCEFLNLLSLISITAEKLAQDFFTLQRDEIAEVKEPLDSTKQISSSTMPHKQNPKGCESIMGFSKLIRSSAHALMETPIKDERDRSPFWVEDMAIPQACILTTTILRILQKMLESLEVFPEAMEKNIQATQGLIMSENIMIGISRKTGRKQSAHHWVSQCAAKAAEKKLPFRQVLLEDGRIREYLTPEEINGLLNPHEYIGLSEKLVDRVVNSCKE